MWQPPKGKALRSTHPLGLNWVSAVRNPTSVALFLATILATSDKFPLLAGGGFRRPGFQTAQI